MTPDIQTLGKQYLDFVVNEIPFGRQRPRSPPTVSSFRRAVEGFIEAARGQDLSNLSPHFVEEEWMRTQQSVLHQPIQLRVRVGAVRKFVQWLMQTGVPVAPLLYPNITTPPPKKKEQTMTDVTQLADPALNENAVPATQTYQPAMQTVVPPPPPAAPRPQPKPQRVAPTNPLAAMFPATQGNWKLRVRREREGVDDPVFLGDFSLERVQLFGAIEPFLSRELAPKVVAQGITGDVTFIVSAVDSSGNEVNKARMTIACSPQTTPMAAPGAPATSTAGQPSAREELLDVLTVERRVREDMENRLTEKLAPTERVNVNNNNSGEMDDLKRMMMSLAGSVQSLAARIEEKEREPVVAPPPPAPVQQQSLGSDMMAMFMKMMEMQRPAPVAAPPPPPQPMGLTEVFGVMTQAKGLFAPAQVNIDVSPLEEQLHEVRKQLNESKKDDITEMVTKFKAMKELFSLVDPASSAPKSTTISSALGGLIEKVVNNPQPLAEAVERVMTGLGALKSQPAGQPQQQLTPKRTQLPQPLLDASRALLVATGDGILLAAHEWLSVLQQVPETQKVAARITMLLQERKGAEFGIVLRQVLAHLGFAEQATAEVVTRISTGVFTKLQQIDEEREEEADEEEDDDEEEGEDSDEQADLTVRVGGTHEDEAQEGEEEEGESEEAEDDAEEESAEEDSSEEEPAEEPAEEEPSTGPVEVTAEELEAIAAAPKRRGRKSKKAEVETVEVPSETRLGLRELPKTEAR